MSKRRRSSKKSGLSYVWQYLMKTFGVALVVFYTLLISVVLYSVFYEIAPAYYYHYNSYAIAGFIILLAVFLGFGIFFNFFMAVLTDPGNTKNLSLKDLHQYNHIEIKSSLNFEETKDATDERDEHEELYPEEFGIKTCKRCSSIKPHRSHHCSICDRCVLKMDHHCPWINNCVGHYNQRYFLLMLLYLLVSVFVYTGLVIPLEFTRDFKEYNLLKSWASEMCFPLCFVIGLVMIPFNGWNWFLAFTGQTTIEFWTRRAEKVDPEIADPESPTTFGHPDKRRNLQDIFGTQSFSQIILPSIRSIRDGVNWEVIKPTATMKISIPL